MAQNPQPYAVLGDVIYDNVDKIEQLESYRAYELYKEDIAKYIADVSEAKEMGYLLESSAKSVNKKEYLMKLRELSKKNDFYTRTVHANYISSMRDGDYLLFSKLINSGMIDVVENRDEIMEYYFNHAEDINASGVIQGYLDEEAEIEARRAALTKRYKSKAELQKEKIQRIRKNDKLEQERLEKELQAEVKQKKQEIREHQKSELKK